jgi:hypothetical protein
MTADTRSDDSLSETALQVYTYICLTALVVMFLVLLRRGLGSWSFLAPVVGLLGVGLRLRLGPLLTLIVMTFLLYAREPVVIHTFPFISRAFSLSDWLLSVSLLAYFAGHYRLQGLTQSILPSDLRRRKGTEPEGESKAAIRDPRLVQSAEVGWLLLLLPVFALAAQLIWRLLPQDEGNRYGLDVGKWRGITTAWLAILLLLAIAGLLRYLRWRGWSRRQASLVLQDALWQETRREQRSLAGWIAWARTRQPKGDKP